MFTLLVDVEITWSERDVIQPKNVVKVEQWERFKEKSNTKKTDTYDKKGTTEISGTKERHSRELNTYRIYWEQEKEKKHSVTYLPSLGELKEEQWQRRMIKNQTLLRTSYRKMWRAMITQTLNDTIDIQKEKKNKMTSTT